MNLCGRIPDKFARLVTTAPDYVAALAWHAAIQNLFDRLYGEAGAAVVGGSSTPC